jgi:hypothetical protein
MKELLSIAFLGAFTAVCVYAGTETLKAKEQYRIGYNYSFSYQFASKPKIGTAVLKIFLLNKEGKKVKDFDIFGSYDMPSMRGHHASGPDKIKTNKKNEYLMPVNFVMPGEWEIILDFHKDGENIYSGEILVSI